MTSIPVFKSISIGGLTKEALFNQLTISGIQFNKYAHTLFEDSSFSPGDKSEIVNLAKVTLKDLGITKPSPFNEIARKATALNLKLCPLEVGAFLRLEYLNQPEGPYLTIASPKLSSEENYPNGFYIRNLDGALWLRGYYASDDYAWPIESEFIFLK
jgi:hypothetical protein